MGTRVRLTRSGGLAGLSMVASVDLDDLRPATAEKVRSALAEMELETAPAPPKAGRREAPAPPKAGRREAPAPPKAGRRQAPAPRPWPGAADTYQYDLEVDDGEKRSITVHDPVSSPEMQALLDVLLPLAEPE